MHQNRKASLALVLLDFVMLLLAFNAAGWMRGIISPAEWIILPLCVPLLLVVASIYLIDGYKAQTDMISLDYTSEHIIALLAAMVGTLLFTFVFLTGGYPLQQSRGVILLSFLIYIPLSLGYRRAVYSAGRALRREQSLVFVGDAETGAVFEQECLRMGCKQPIVHASPTQENEAPDNSQIDTVLGKIERGEIEVEAVILRENNRDLNSHISQRLVELYFRGVPTYTLELFHQVYWRKIPLYRLNQTWLFQEGFKIAREPVFERLKRLSDIFLSLFALTIGAPLFLGIALAIWIDDRGPVLFCQTRIGKNRVPFRLFKFRTMRPNDGKDVYTKVGDMRITRIGKFLRSSRLDELPQMLNVLFGDMSLIGPRAEWDKLVDKYETQIPCYHFRHLVKPGITGWAQVNYPYGANLDDTLRKLEYDLYYIRHFSFLIDAAIVLKTIHIMLFGKGR
ncbi:exopolysaccharide biosynthesis polyprenyl glycosylphosphotransferase [Rariglobus hedericola]|uniref:Exopolysaccharide biosynthesis polyprenyl glycosylphosphotransferase n=1 Tax=Rariglobus hedericola TaxID=2597822 RepID=A0A556QPY0_9BACT|nr:exopolysaccharide biosynthesis polyprenyl glycosylphosphotransferase [Rariglobus hedericola]TSJ78700.1 exopolysaccharide biosynthesis polyprenyl glycosylphosphotransferase [Rariglobus hedericola]